DQHSRRSSAPGLGDRRLGQEPERRAVLQLRYFVRWDSGSAGDAADLRGDGDDSTLAVDRWPNGRDLGLSSDPQPFTDERDGDVRPGRAVRADMVHPGQEANLPARRLEAWLLSSHRPPHRGE